MHDNFNTKDDVKVLFYQWTLGKPPIYYCFNGSAIEPPPPLSFMAVGTLAVEKKVLKSSFSLTSHPLPPPSLIALPLKKCCAFP